MYKESTARKYQHSQSANPHLTLGKSKKSIIARRVFVVKVVAFLVFLGVLASIILSMDARLTEQSEKVSAMKKEYSKLLSENKKAEIEINKKIDLKTVEEIAISNYNMNRARKSQVVYIDVKAEDYGVVNSANEDDDQKVGLKSALEEYLD